MLRVSGIDTVQKFRQCMAFLQLLVRGRAKQPAEATSPRQLLQDMARTGWIGDVSPRSGEVAPALPVASVAHSSSVLRDQQGPSLMLPAAGMPNTTSAESTSGQGQESPKSVSSEAANLARTNYRSPRKLLRKKRHSSEQQVDIQDRHEQPPGNDRRPDTMDLAQTMPEDRYASMHQPSPSFNTQSPRHQQSPPVYSQPVSPNSTSTSPRSQQSPHISPSSKTNLSKNQKPVFASVFEQKRAEDIQRRSQRLLAVQNAHEQKQQSLILSQLILLEKEQR